MRHETNSLETKDGLVLHTNAWQTDSPIADIHFVHGFFEHSGRYEREAHFFNNQGFDFYSYDQRTHGLSAGEPRSFVASFDDYLEDYKHFLSSTIKEDKPYFLFSHSMGGLVLCSYLLDQKKLSENFKGAIFSAPLIMPDKNTAPLLQKLSGVVGTLFPRLKAVAIDANAVSRDPVEVEKYKSDPLNYTDKMYAGSGYQLLKQMKEVQNRLHEFTHPFLVLHGTDDKLTEIHGSRHLYKAAASVDKEFIELQNFKHEITKDLGKEEVLNTILSWMQKRI